MTFHHCKDNIIRFISIHKQCSTAARKQHEISSFGPPMEKILAPVNLFLQLEKSIEQGFCCRRATWDINVHWNNPIAAPDNRVGVMVVSTTICTASHRYYPSRFWHLVINLAQSRGHLVGESASNNHAIGLTRAGPENDPEAVKIIASGSRVHHLNGAACQPECHRPYRPTSCPVQQIVHFRDHVFRRLR